MTDLVYVCAHEGNTYIFAPTFGLQDGHSIFNYTFLHPISAVEIDGGRNKIGVIRGLHEELSVNETPIAVHSQPSLSSIDGVQIITMFKLEPDTWIEIWITYYVALKVNRFILFYNGYQTERHFESLHQRLRAQFPTIEVHFLYMDKVFENPRFAEFNHEVFSCAQLFVLKSASVFHLSKAAYTVFIDLDEFLFPEKIGKFRLADHSLMDAFVGGRTVVFQNVWAKRLVDAPFKLKLRVSHTDSQDKRTKYAYSQEFQGTVGIHQPECEISKPHHVNSNWVLMSIINIDGPRCERHMHNNDRERELKQRGFRSLELIIR